jgi:hypothetical protein
MSSLLDHDATSPFGMKPLSNVYDDYFATDLDGELVDLIYLRASQLTGWIRRHSSAGVGRQAA